MTPREPNITIRAVQPFVAGLEALGHDKATILRDAGIEPSMLANPDERIPHSTMMRLWTLAETFSSDPFIGLHIAEIAPLESFEIHGYAFASSATLREALERGVRYQRLIHEATSLLLEERDDRAVLRHSLPGGLAVPRQPAEFLAAVWLRFARGIAGDDLTPILVRFAHEAGPDGREYARYFRCPVQFSSGLTALELPIAHLAAPSSKADPAQLRIIERYADSLLPAAPSNSTLADRVRSWVAGRITSEAPRAQDAAAAMNMSLRSFHRALRDEGLTWKALLEAFRRERAATLLQNTDCSISEVAYLLGFSEVSAFTRAFKRWTGSSPLDYRQRIPISR